MKKEYLSPATNVFVIHTNNVILGTSGEHAGVKQSSIDFDHPTTTNNHPTTTNDRWNDQW